LVLGHPPQRGQYPTVQLVTLESPQYNHKSALTTSTQHPVFQKSRE